MNGKNILKSPRSCNISSLSSNKTVKTRKKKIEEALRLFLLHQTIDFSICICSFLCLTISSYSFRLHLILRWLYYSFFSEMAASSLLLHNPSCNFYVDPSYYSRTSEISTRFRRYSSIIIPRGFPLYLSGARSMTGLVKRFGCRDGNEQIGAVEQESFIKGNEMVAGGGGIEAILNHLVSNWIENPSCTQCVRWNASFFLWSIFLWFSKWQSKWVVSGLFASIILLRHDGAALWAIIGSVSNSALSVGLKRILNQERPDTTSRTDPGMPSTHAQSISFISVFAVLSGKQLKKHVELVFVCSHSHGTV